MQCQATHSYMCVKVIPALTIGLERLRRSANGRMKFRGGDTSDVHGKVAFDIVLKMQGVKIQAAGVDFNVFVSFNVSHAEPTNAQADKKIGSPGHLNGHV